MTSSRTALENLAAQSLHLWELGDEATARLINLSENATFLVEDKQSRRTILRIHRPDYHNEAAILSELTWMKALTESGQIITPKTLAGRNGKVVQLGENAYLGARFMVMFEYINGHEPDENQPLAELFHHLGKTAATLHHHTENWVLPKGFTRPEWDVEGIFGARKYWGDWRDAPALDGSMAEILERCEQHLRRTLERYGKKPDRYGLIHADMRLANLLVVDGDMTQVRVIDFDDCGFGWFLYDFAAGVSFIEDTPQMPQLIEAWIDGYQTVRRLAAEDISMIATFVMLRRMILLAWLGNRQDADIVATLAGDFASTTVHLAENYLATD